MAAKSLVQTALNTTLGFFYPEVCALCKDEPATPDDGFVGAKCRRTCVYPPAILRTCGLPFQGDFTPPFECTNCREMELHFSSARSAAVAKTVVLEAIHHFKYSRALWFENFLAGLLIAEAAPVLRGQKESFIVPVPLHPSKSGSASSTRPTVLAGRLAGATAIPLNEKTAAPRQTHGNANASQTRRTRHEHARGFRHPQWRKVNGSGSSWWTTSSPPAQRRMNAPERLREAGAGDVCVWTVARGL